VPVVLVNLLIYYQVKLLLELKLSAPAVSLLSEFFTLLLDPEFVKLLLLELAVELLLVPLLDLNNLVGLLSGALNFISLAALLPF